MAVQPRIPVIGGPAADRDGITVAVCQLAPRIGERERNLQRVTEAVRTAAAAGARLVVLPELVSSGYVFRDEAEARELAESVDGPFVQRLCELAAELGVVIVAGVPELAGGTLYNSAVLVDRRGLREVYRKAHLWDREKLVFTPGDAVPPVVDTELGRIGIVICYDLEFPEWMREVALRGADIICAPTNWPGGPRPTGERPVEVVGVQASAAANRVFVAAADRAGHERGVDWVSGSTIMGPSGYPLALADLADREQILVATCRLEDARTKELNARNDVFGDRRTDLYRAVVSSTVIA